MSNRLLEGTRSPQLRVNTYDGRPLDLHSYLGKKSVWLGFYRYASCPLCQMHIHDVQSHLPLLGQGDIEFIGVFESRPEQFRSVSSRPLPTGLNLVADPDKKAYELFGVERSMGAVVRPSVFYSFAKATMQGYRQGPIEGDLGQIPAHFLIDPQGIIRVAHYGSSISDHISLARVRQFAETKR